MIRAHVRRANRSLRLVPPRTELNRAESTWTRCGSLVGAGILSWLTTTRAVLRRRKRQSRSGGGGPKRQTRPNTHTSGPCAPVGKYKIGAGTVPRFFLISCARACTVACEVSTEAQFFADCKLHILTRPTRFGRWQFLEKISPSWPP